MHCYIVFLFMKRETISMKMDTAVWKKAKIYAIKHDITVSGLVEQSLMEKMKNR